MNMDMRDFENLPKNGWEDSDQYKIGRSIIETKLRTTAAHKDTCRDYMMHKDRYAKLRRYQEQLVRMLAYEQEFIRAFKYAKKHYESGAPIEKDSRLDKAIRFITEGYESIMRSTVYGKDVDKNGRRKKKGF